MVLVADIKSLTQLSHTQGWLCLRTVCKKIRKKGGEMRLPKTSVSALGSTKTMLLRRNTFICFRTPKSLQPLFQICFKHCPLLFQLVSAVFLGVSACFRPTQNVSALVSGMFQPVSAPKITTPFSTKVLMLLKAKTTTLY
jgi:hypothetical protein